MKALAHDKKPVVAMGQKGLTESLVRETQAALLAHELVKVRFHQKETSKDDAAALARDAGAELVAVLGHIGILYRKHPDQPRIHLPVDRRAKGRAAAPHDAPADDVDDDVDEDDLADDVDDESTRDAVDG